MKLSEIRHSTSDLQGFFRDLSTVPKQAPNSACDVLLQVYRYKSLSCGAT